MNLLKFFTDEDVYGAIAVELRRNGYDAVSTPGLRRLHESDDSQLDWATAENCTLVTFNVAHFAKLHTKIIEAQGHHAGIIVSGQLPLGEVLRRLLRLASNLDAEAMRDRIEFLSDWKGD